MADFKTLKIKETEYTVKDASARTTAQQALVKADSALQPTSSVTGDISLTASEDVLIEGATSLQLESAGDVTITSTGTNSDINLEADHVKVNGVDIHMTNVVISSKEVLTSHWNDNGYGQYYTMLEYAIEDGCYIVTPSCFKQTPSGTDYGSSYSAAKYNFHTEIRLEAGVNCLYLICESLPSLTLKFYTYYYKCDGLSSTVVNYTKKKKKFSKIVDETLTSDKTTLEYALHQKYDQIIVQVALSSYSASQGYRQFMLQTAPDQAPGTIQGRVEYTIGATTIYTLQYFIDNSNGLTRTNSNITLGVAFNNNINSLQSSPGTLLLQDGIEYLKIWEYSNLVFQSGTQVRIYAKEAD